MTGVPVHRLRLYLTTRCPARCDHCFVRKSGRTVSETTAEQALSLLLDSPGRDKALLLLGGEPFAAPDRLFAVVRAATERARRSRRRLRISIATNGLCHQAEQVERLRPYPVRLAVSLDGTPADHDRHRRFAGGGPTRATAEAAAREMLAILGPARVCVLLGIHPDAAARMATGAAVLRRLGFTSLNPEPMQGPIWPTSALTAFRRGMKALLAGLRRGMRRGRPWFLNPVSRELADGSISAARRDGCPIRRNLEVYPDGRIWTSPFAANAAVGGRRAWGRVDEGSALFDRLGCRAGDPAVCAACRRRTERIARTFAPPCEALRIRDEAVIRFAREARQRAADDPAWRDWVAAARTRRFE